jgi:hypothetical protein
MGLNKEESARIVVMIDQLVGIEFVRCCLLILVAPDFDYSLGGRD